MIDLKKLRENQNLTQEQLAAAIGKTRTLITAIETGQTNPSVDTAKKLAELLKFDWVLFFE